MRKGMLRGSYTIEASVYVPMMMLFIMAVLQSGIGFYQQSKMHEPYKGLTAMNAVDDFYTYQIVEEIGKEWIDD